MYAQGLKSTTIKSIKTLPIFAAGMCTVLLFLMSCGSNPKPVEHHEVQTKIAKNDLSKDQLEKPRNLGWFDEEMPQGMRKAAKKPLYVWNTRKGIELEMLYVSPGNFLMGTDDSPKKGEIINVRPGMFISTPPDSFKPLHNSVIRKGYYIARVEVTWDQYRTFCQQMKWREPRAPIWDAKKDHPVVNVAWSKAKAFCRWAGLSLPTEAQWEKAARGTDGRIYPWGNEWDPTRANFCDVSCPENYSSRNPRENDGFAYTAPVGSYPRGQSPYGVLDMAGNVREWCSDEYFESSSGWETAANHGGSWASSAKDCRSGRRSMVTFGNPSPSIGFRPIKNIDE